jgi:hypothetical protein
MSGEQVAAELRNFPSTAVTRLAAMVGFNQEEGALPAGFDTAFVKPVEIELLLRFIEETATQFGLTSPLG